MTAFMTRTLHVTVGGDDHPVLVAFEPPAPGDGFWQCTCTIGWPEGPTSDQGYGADGPQALLSAMTMAMIRLYASSHHHEGRLRWDRPGEGYGFPGPRGSRDLLVGRDREWFGDGPQDPRDTGQGS